MVMSIIDGVMSENEQFITVDIILYIYKNSYHNSLIEKNFLTFPLNLIVGVKRESPIIFIFCLKKYFFLEYPVRRVFLHCYIGHTSRQTFYNP